MRRFLLCALTLALLLMPAALAETTAATVPAIDLTALINAVIALLAALVTYRLVPWLKARTSSTQQELLAAAIRTAVYAAEQLYRTDVIGDRLDYAENWLREHGYTVSRAEIEAAVRQMQEFTQTINFQETIAGTLEETEEKQDG